MSPPLPVVGLQEKRGDILAEAEEVATSHKDAQ